MGLVGGLVIREEEVREGVDVMENVVGEMKENRVGEG